MGAPRFRQLPRPAQVAIAAAAALAVAATVVVSVDAHAAPSPGLLAVLAAACLAAALLETPAPGGRALHPGVAPLVWGAVVLPPAALPALALLCCLPGALRASSRWYVLAVNAAALTLSALAAHAVARGGTPVADVAAAGSVAALFAAAAAFVAVNHSALAVIVRASGQPRPARAPVLRSDVTLDLALAVCGVLLAVLSQREGLLTLLAAGPLFVVGRALRVPALSLQAATDPKTGLFHLVRFDRELDDAIATARRRDEPLSVLMVDLDHLRAINNRFGHLAGDRAIREVADRLSAAAGDRGIAARFGGEEFCLLLPQTEVQDALPVAEALRAEVEAAGWVEHGEAVALAVSVGVAAFPQHGGTAPELVRAADAALYEAKLDGRNRVRVALAERVQRSLADELPGLEAFAAAPAPVPLRPPLVAAPAAVPPSDPPPAPAPPPRTARFVPWYVGLLLLGAATVGALTGFDGLAERPWLVVALVVAVVALDAVRIDLFERGTISPASVPTLALACVAGPAGPLAAEAAIALARIARGVTPVRWAFDLGALGLVGAAAAAVFAVLPGDGAALVVVAGPVAGLAYYVGNVALLSVVMGLAEGIPPTRAWRERLAWLWPHFVLYGVLGAGVVVLARTMGPATVAVFLVPLGAVWISQKQYVERVRGSVGEARRRHDELSRANRELQLLLDEKRRLLARMQRSYLSTITSLARTIEAKDPYTGGHTERVARLALLLAEDLGLTPDQRRAVEVGAVIHDIGKIGVPDRVLLKPGRLDPDEVGEMRRHPEISSYIVGELELPRIVKQMVRSHHERFDGTGYPDRLAGDEIPIAARILAVADTLDAMTSDRPYREALALPDAITEIRRQAGRQFCPQVVAVLLARIAADPGLRGCARVAVTSAA